MLYILINVCVEIQAYITIMYDPYTYRLASATKLDGAHGQKSSLA